MRVRVRVRVRVRDGRGVQRDGGAERVRVRGEPRGRDRVVRGRSRGRDVAVVCGNIGSRAGVSRVAGEVGCWSGWGVAAESALFMTGKVDSRAESYPSVAAGFPCVCAPAPAVAAGCGDASAADWGVTRPRCKSPSCWPTEALPGVKAGAGSAEGVEA